MAKPDKGHDYTVHVRVVTWNLLSPALVKIHRTSAEYAPYEPCRRLMRIKDALCEEMSHPSIICLQEVCRDWIGELHVLFAAHQYYFVMSDYGSPSTGYMGVGIAYPMNTYRMVDVTIERVVDTKAGGWYPGGSLTPPKVKPFGAKGNTPAAYNAWMGWPFVSMYRIGTYAMNLLLSNLQKVKGFLPWPKIQDASRSDAIVKRLPKDEDPWPLVSKRYNTLVALTLRPLWLASNDECGFTVVTYHMPCQFECPAAMTIHTSLLLQAVQRIDDREYPIILAGDFNFQPSSHQYSLVVNGKISPDAVAHAPGDEAVDGKRAYPSAPLYPGDPFEVNAKSLVPMTDAYDPDYHFNLTEQPRRMGKMPKFTNLAEVDDNAKDAPAGKKKRFQAVLDYIFFCDGSEHGIITSCNTDDLSEQCSNILNSGSDSLPYLGFPSDHLKVGANIGIRWNIQNNSGSNKSEGND